MLILTRKVGEKVMIGEIELNVLFIGNNQIRLGFDGPKEINIVRKEILTRDKKTTTEEFA